MSAAYAPRGFPKAAIDHITAHGPTFSGPLGEAIGCDSRQLTMMLDAAVRNGALVKERKLHMGSSCNLWSLGNGVPISRPLDDDQIGDGDTPPPVRPRAPSVFAAAAAIAPAPATAPALKDHTAIDDPEPDNRPRAERAKPAPALAPVAAPTAASSCEFALTSSGRLLIDVGGEKLALTKAQADQLIAYLVRTRLTASEVTNP